MQSPHVTNMDKEVSMLSMLSPHTVVEHGTPFGIMKENTYFFPQLISLKKEAFPHN